MIQLETLRQVFGDDRSLRWLTVCHVEYQQGTGGGLQIPGSFGARGGFVLEFWPLDRLIPSGRDARTHGPAQVA
jgi:hypothetical protein